VFFFEQKVFVLYYPDVFSLDVEKDFGRHLGDINVAYCEVNKDAKQIMHQEYYPNNGK